MKAIIKASVLAVFLLGSVVTMAQNKIGHINSQELMLAMPERADVEKAIQAEATAMESQLQAMSAEYQAKVADYQNTVETSSDLIKQTKVQEIQQLEQRIQQFQQSAQTQLQTKEQELFKPLIEKAKEAISVVAKANGFTYVIDSGLGSLLVMPDGDDMMDLVKKQMGIPLTAATPQ